MKKHFLLFALMVLPLLASAAAVEINGIYYNLETNENVADVTRNPNKYTGSITIPESVTYNNVDYSVTRIEAYAFSSCSGLTSVTIPNSVTSIGSKAFYECSGLTSVTIPNSVTIIWDWTFSGCSGLTSVTIGNSVTSLEVGAFDGCSSLTSVTIPNSVTSIKSKAFHNCSGLTSITIPNSVTSFGESAFDGCSSLTSVTIPNSMTSIGKFAFSRCSGLKSITIPNSVTYIGKSTFASCPEIKDVYCYAENVPTANSEAFKDSNIENATLHVPANSVNAYKAAAPWNSFKEIVALTDDDPKPTGIDEVRSNTSDVRAAFFDLNGRRLNGEPIQKGVYIQNGKKIIVK